MNEPAASRYEEPAQGTVLGNRYQIVERIGGGGMSTVYRATDARTGAVVAVKLLHPRLAHDPAHAARVRREVQIAASLVSPRVVRVTDLDEHAGVPFVVMEYVPGETLRERLRSRGRFSPSEALLVGLEVARALEAAHARGIVHRDLKPGNVMLFDGHVKVLDFGIARAEADLDVPATAGYAGTLAYSAPEQRAGHADIRADIYALGVLLFELLEGYVPPPGAPVFSTAVPDVMGAVVTRCLAVDPDARYQTPGELADGLLAALRALPGGADAGMAVVAGLSVSPAVGEPVRRPAEPVGLLAAAREVAMAPAGAPADAATRTATEAGGPGSDARASVVPALPPAASNNLPAPLTSFVGRVWEMTEIRRVLDTTRLLTLSGPGGSGKTRLALQVAAGARGPFRDGVWLVDLATRTPGGAGESSEDKEALALVAQAVASTLGVREAPGEPLMETLANALRSRRMLLLLDNCEHLLEACAALADRLLRACPDLKILVTSREPLGMAGEAVWRVPPLAVPDPARPPPVERLLGYDAVRLFTERARASTPGFALTPANAGAVATLCGRLDGIPLALELAAAQLREMALEEVVAGLDARFRLLVSGNRTALPRQQTLRAALDWSHDLLGGPERITLRRLSAFAGGFDGEMAASVCGGDGSIDAGEVAGLLSRLVDRSLVVAESVDGRPRYRLLETVREYGAERLAEAGEMASVRGRHAETYLRVAEAAEPALTGPGQGLALKTIEGEHDNLRAALGWAAECGDAETGLRLAGALWQFWAVRGHLGEGRRWLEWAAGLHGAAPRRFKVLNGAGNLAYAQGDYPRATALHEESLAVSRAAGDRAGEAMALTNLGFVAAARADLERAAALYEEALVLARAQDDRRGIAVMLNSLGLVLARQGDATRASALLEESLALRRELGDRQGIAVLLNNLGMIASRRGAHDRAAALYEECLTLRRELGDRQGAAAALTNLGMVAQERGEHARAEALHEESLTLLRALGDRRGEAVALANLGLAAAAEGAHPRAVARFREALMLRRELGDLPGIASCLEGLAGCAQAQGAPARAARLGGAADAVRERSGVHLLPAERAAHGAAQAAARAALGEEAYAAAWAGGRALEMEAAISEVLDGDGADRRVATSRTAPGG